MNSTQKLGSSDIKVLDGDRGTNYPKKDEFSSSGYCLFLDASNVTKTGFSFEKKQFISQDKDQKLRGGKLKRDDIVLTTRGTIGNFAHYSSDIPYDNMRINSGMLILRNGEEFDTAYLYQLLKSDYIGSQIKNITTGSSQPQITRAIVNELNLLKPSLSIQRKIAAVLSALDDKIELNRRINAELEQMARTLYDYWFVQFDFPDTNGKPYKSSGGAMKFSPELNREIPEGWDVVSLGDVADIYQPQILSAKDLTMSEKYPVHGSNGIIGTYHEYNHKDSEVIVSCRGDCGNIHRTPPMTWITGNAMVFKIKDCTIHNEFMYQALRHVGLKQISSGSVQGQITRTNVSPLKIVWPNRENMDKYSRFAEVIVTKRLLLQNESQKLAELRDWLLPMLMNGQVSVK